MGAFLENVFEFKTNNTSDFVSYLNYWEKKGKHERVVMTEGIDAVRIMTIHKAKGLEFPVVIIPFATDKLSKLGTKKFGTLFLKALIALSNGQGLIFQQVKIFG